LPYDINTLYINHFSLLGAYMPLLLIIGCVLILAGIALFVAWAGYFWLLFKALFPLVIIALGGLMTYFGWEEKKDRKGAFLEFSTPAEATRYQADALAYQEKINNLQETEIHDAEIHGTEIHDAEIIDTKSLDVDPLEPLEAKQTPELMGGASLEKTAKD
jgi:hypothetical protein